MPLARLELATTIMVSKTTDFTKFAYSGLFSTPDGSRTHTFIDFKSIASTNLGYGSIFNSRTYESYIMLIISIRAAMIRMLLFYSFFKCNNIVYFIFNAIISALTTIFLVFLCDRRRTRPPANISTDT